MLYRDTLYPRLLQEVFFDKDVDELGDGDIFLYCAGGLFAGPVRARRGRQRPPVRWGRFSLFRFSPCTTSHRRSLFHAGRCFLILA